ncbi:hypothetical protein CAC42_4247 [Sphaceloma murrayae]|uniref:B-related factor 1 n=1 Tax=Sphaceloma murrayae TaxID=2082308 RepID=A0A2K1QKW5_9PEZI|nr:hypothetical protein CAC42_4247 [Sphaceloma murrayae]
MSVAAPTIKPAKRINRLRNKTFTPIPAQPPPPPLSTTAQKQTRKCCDEPQHETHDGVLLCVNCGTQISENNIVAEVTFGETSTGAAQVQGGYVGQDSRYAKTLGGQASRRIGGQYQSREETEQNGRSELRQLGTQLRIPTHVEDVAFSLWKLAATHNFIQGRRTNEVAGACLYAACRREENNTIMLMDISEAQSVNVFKLGDIYKELCKTLYLEAHHHVKPVMEVEPLIMKYCSRLEFGDKTREVAADAARIIKRMKRDWMVTGRHPAGLCGACIILAARMNNFRRTVREVVYIVKVSDLTIASRLQEFKNTRSSTMSVKDFRDKGHRVKYAHDPPSVNAAKKRQEKLERAMKRRAARMELMASGGMSDTASIVSTQSSATIASQTAEGASDTESGQIFHSVDNEQPATDSVQTQTTDDEQDPTDNESASAAQGSSEASSTIPTKRKRSSARTHDKITQQQQQQQQQQTPPATAEQSQPESEPSASQASEPMPDATSQAPSTTEGPRRDADGFVIPQLPSASQARASATPTPEGEPAPKKRRKAAKPIIKLTEADFASESELAEDIETILQDPTCVSAREDTEREKLEQRAAVTADEQRALSLAALTARLAARGCGTAAISDSEIISPEEFADDPEVANALLDEEAVKVKETIWLRDNEDWLRAQQAKLLRQELEKAEGRSEKKKKKRKRSRMGDGTVLTEKGTPVMSPADAAQRMLEKRGTKGYSKNIDYAALNRVFGGDVGPSETEKKRMRKRDGSEVPSESGASTAASRRSSVSSNAAARPKIGEGSFIMEDQGDVSSGKIAGKRAERKALERVRRSSGSGSATPEREAVTPAPGSEKVDGTEENVEAPAGPGAQQDAAIEIPDNNDEEDDDDDEDEDEDEDTFEAAESWAGDVPEEQEFDDEGDVEDAAMNDFEGDPDVYGSGLGTF